MIRHDKLTIKTQEALQSAQEIGQKLNHQEIDCEHLLSALIQQPDGLVRPLLDKLGLDSDALLQKYGRDLTEDARQCSKGHAWGYWGIGVNAPRVTEVERAMLET